LVVLKRVESFSNLVQAAQILNSLAPLVIPFTDYSFMEYLGDYWNSDMSFGLNDLLEPMNSRLKKQIDLKEFTTFIKSKIKNFNDQMLPSKIISFILDNASKEIKVDIENWIHKTFRFSFGYTFNCPNCKQQNNGQYFEFVLDIKVDHGENLNLDDYLKNLATMVYKSCTNCHVFNKEMVTITNLPEVFLIQIENQANQQIDYGIENIQIASDCQSKYNLVAIGLDNSKSICLNSTTFNWHLFSENKADIITHDQFFKHQPSFFAYRRISKNEKDLQAKIMEKTYQEKSKQRENAKNKKLVQLVI
jgi:hypothetical protein